MMNKAKNKKAQLSEFLSDTFLLIFAVFALVVFFAASSAFFSGDKRGIENYADKTGLESEGQLSLQAFLQKPVEIEIDGEKQEISEADLIRLGRIDSKYKDVLKSEIKIFDSYYDYIFKEETQGQQAVPDWLKAYEGFGAYYDYEFSAAYFHIPSKEPISAMLKINGVKK